FSPDGKYLSYPRTFGTDMIIQQRLNHGGPRDLFIRPVEGGEPINLTARWDLEPGPSQWSPDSRFIYFTAEIGGESHLFRVSVPGGHVEQVTKGERSEEHTSELQSRVDLVCRLLLEKKKRNKHTTSSMQQ